VEKLELVCHARGGKLQGRVWVWFLGCASAPLLLQGHAGKETEGEPAAEAEPYSATALMPASLLLPREANAASASPGRRDAPTQRAAPA